MTDTEMQAADLRTDEQAERGERVAVIDYKMVTFSLAGKDYAIDIMQVKEIAKAGRFTYVPNTSPFVLGVYNLRGDIIPIIDLRIFFNIPTKPREKDALENMIIISVDDQTFGIVVDAIDKVVGISKSTIQPPHPIFGDINIKYIHGVVENQGRLYILLDVNRIFASRAKTQESEVEQDTAQIQTLKSASLSTNTAKNSDQLDVSFIADSLGALARFSVTVINEAWVTERYRQWRDQRPHEQTQLQNEEDARQYLSTFASPSTGTFWSDSYSSDFLALLPDNPAKQIHVWDIGCAKGHEAYSLAVLLRERYPNARIRIFANDSDLLSISNAPMLSVNDSEASPRFKPWLVKGTGGAQSFNQSIKDMILFEYHDCTNQNAIPNMDIIVCRDVLSYMPASKQTALIEEFSEKLKDNGLLILGRNEVMPRQSGWLRHVNGEVIAFSKE